MYSEVRPPLINSLPGTFDLDNHVVAIMKTVLNSRGSERAVQLPASRDEQGDREPGSSAGKIKIGAEFFEPLPPEELDLWQ